MTEDKCSQNTYSLFDSVFEYHTATKHSFSSFAKGPDNLDWANQPDPFRNYTGAPFLALERSLSPTGVLYDQAFYAGLIEPVAVDRQSLSRFFLQSLAISAWKSFGGVSWALRVNPSSGNLHPTEGYLLCGPIEGLSEKPMVSHYSPRTHGLEVRAELGGELWQKLIGNFPEDTFFIGLTSIHWREAWKYGQRAFRYSQLDIGHAIGAISIAAAGQGWRCAIVDDIGSSELGVLLGISGQDQGEPEEAEVLIAVEPQRGEARGRLPKESIESFKNLQWLGTPNRLSSFHVDWNIDQIARTVRKPWGTVDNTRPLLPLSTAVHKHKNSQVQLDRIISQRRSAVAMDRETRISRDTFYNILHRVAAVTVLPFASLCWPPQIHMVIFVHRVDDLPPGLYFLLRNVKQQKELEQSFSKIDKWQPAPGCLENMQLYLLEEGDVQDLASKVSCFQEIAGDGCFSLGMIAQFESSLLRHGPWFYPHLFWEAGLIGQMLYLEAEAAGVRGTGIGCFFDDAMHNILGIKDRKFQDLYHFTVGGPLEDSRLQTLTPYQDDG